MGLRGRAWVAQINSLHQRFALTPKTRLRRQFLCFRIVQLRYGIYLLSRPPIQQSVTYSFYDFLFPGARFSMGCAKIRPSAWFSRDGLDLDLFARLEAAEHLYNCLRPSWTPASIVSFLLFRRSRPEIPVFDSNHMQFFMHSTCDIVPFLFHISQRLLLYCPI